MKRRWYSHALAQLEAMRVHGPKVVAVRRGGHFFLEIPDPKRGRRIVGYGRSWRAALASMGAP